MTIRRNLTHELLTSLGDSPVVYLHGGRQTGKTTLAREVAAGPHPARYLSFDDLGVLALAREDPQGFIRGLEGPVVLDEVQRCPEVFPAIKAAVDEDRRPGRFLLTGSASVLLLPGLAEHLVGRMEILTLRGFSQGEIEGVVEGFADLVFDENRLVLQSRAEEPSGVWDRVVRGGFPEALNRASTSRRSTWFGSYIQTILQREVSDLARVEGLTRLPDLLRLLAARAGGLLNLSELSRSARLPRTTLERYVALLEATFLVHRLPAWSPNLGKRLVKSPKVFLADTGLTAHLLGVDVVTGDTPPGIRGALLEGFVSSEIEKQATWSRAHPRLFHYRSHGGHEVDLVLEDASGRCVGIETKSSTTVRPADFAGLQKLADLLTERFVRGIVLHTGREAVSLDDRFMALPVDALWHYGVRPHDEPGFPPSPST